MGLIRDSFIIFKNWTDAINELPEEYQLETYKALIKYGTTGEMPEDISPVTKAMLVSFSVSMEKSICRYNSAVENGKLGGRPRRNETEDNRAETQNNPTKPNETEDNRADEIENLNDNVNVNDKVNFKVSKKVSNKEIFKITNNACAREENSLLSYDEVLSEFGVKHGIYRDALFRFIAHLKTSFDITMMNNRLENLIIALDRNYSADYDKSKALDDAIVKGYRYLEIETSDE